MSDAPAAAGSVAPRWVTPLILGLAILAAAAVADRVRFADPDLFMNLFSARDMLAAGGLPAVDTHSFAREALPWTDYEWGARIIQYGVHGAAGGPGLVLLRVVQVLLAAGALLLAARRAGASAPAAALALAISWWAVAHFFLIRARTFSFVAMAVLIWLLVEHRRGSRWAVWLIPPLILVWVNLHGAYLLGLGMIGLAVLDALVPRAGGEAVRTGWWKLAVATVIAGLLTFVHPEGGGVLAAVARTITGSAGATISEWQPLWAHPLSASFSYIALLPVAAVVALWRAVRRRDLLWPGLLMVLGIETVLHVRFGALLGLALTVPLALELHALLQTLRLAVRGTITWATAGVLAASLIAVPLAWGHRDLHLRMDPDWSPVAAVHFLQANDIEGDILCEFDWGAYLIWELPAARVFIDGRWDTVYPPEVNEEWTTFATFADGWEAVLADSGATAVLLRTGRGAEAPIAASPEWGLVYTDGHASLLLRDVPVNRPFLQRLMVGQIAPPPPATDEDLILR